MQLKKSLCTLALACGLMALPVLAQNSQSSTPPDNSASPSATAPASPTDQAPAASTGSISDQSSNTSAGGQSASASGDSSSVQASIQSALQKDDQLAGQSVNVEVTGKKVMLSGTVSSQAQKDHAEQVATQAAGSGYTVKDKIKVSGSADSGAMPPKQ